MSAILRYGTYTAFVAADAPDESVAVTANVYEVPPVRFEIVQVVFPVVVQVFPPGVAVTVYPVGFAPLPAVHDTLAAEPSATAVLAKAVIWFLMPGVRVDSLLPNGEKRAVNLDDAVVTDTLVGGLGFEDDVVVEVVSGFDEHVL